MKKTTLLSVILLIALASCRHKEKYDATGIFEANTVTVSAETGGKIVSLAIEEGAEERLCRSPSRKETASPSANK